MRNLLISLAHFSGSFGRSGQGFGCASPRPGFLTLFGHLFRGGITELLNSGFDPSRFYKAQAVDEKLSVKMVHFMLQANREQTVGLN
jgi:hypothetical protein